jgi:hypothetical protein
VLQGDLTTYTLSVNRTGGFSGSVSLSIAGLPKKTTASWSPGASVSGTSSSATLQIDTARDTSPESYDLVVTGTGTVNGSPVSRSAAVTLVVEKTQSFDIAGSLGAQLAPGVKAPLNLSLTNPYKFDLRITNLAVTLEEGTSKPGCSGSENFKVTQIPAARYPITLPKNETKTLAQLGVADGDKPKVEMLNRPWNQDNCKNATVTLDYGGSAAK